MQYLRTRPGLQAGRVEESKVPGEGRPDLICKCENGETFYIEVKSLDIVGGEFRHREMMDDALDVQVELEERRKKGRRVTFAEGTINPYKAFGQTEGYDPRSLKLVVDTLRDKCRTAFKPSQFELGPTFALAIVVRTGLPGRPTRASPLLLRALPFRMLRLWRVVARRLRTDRHADLPPAAFRGAADGPQAHLATDGLYADANQPFRGEGLIVLDTHCGERVAYGLASSSASPEPWSVGPDRACAAIDMRCSKRRRQQLRLPPFRRSDDLTGPSPPAVLGRPRAGISIEPGVLGCNVVDPVPGFIAQ